MGRTPFRIKTDRTHLAGYIIGGLLLLVFFSSLPYTGPAECKHASTAGHTADVTYCVKEDN